MKKGFTLVELLAVIIILAALSYITVAAIGGIFKKSKNEIYETQLELIKISAENWVQENPKYVQIATIDNSNISSYLTITDLKESGLLDDSVINPKNGKAFTDGDIVVKITSEYNQTYKKSIFIYEVIDNPIEVVSTINELQHITDMSDND